MANYPFKIGKATVNITEGGIYMHNILSSAFKGRIQFYSNSPTPITYSDIENGLAGGGCFGLLYFMNASYYVYQFGYESSEYSAYAYCQKVSDGSSFTMTFDSSGFRDFVNP